MGRTEAFTLNRPGILGFFCFNARNSYNRIFRHRREAETQLSGRSAARRGVTPVPQPHRAEGCRSPALASCPPATAPAPAPAAPAPSPAPPPLRTYGRAGLGQAGSSSASGPEPAALPPRHRGRRRGRPGAAIPGSRGPGLGRSAGRAARVTRAARWRRDPRSAGSPGGPCCAAAAGHRLHLPRTWLEIGRSRASVPVRVPVLSLVAPRFHRFNLLLLLGHRETVFPLHWWRPEAAKSRRNPAQLPGGRAVPAQKPHCNLSHLRAQS